MRLWIAASFIFVLCHAGVVAADASDAEQAENAADIFDRGLEAWDEGEYFSAYDIWLELAEAGNPRAKLGVAVALQEIMDHYYDIVPMSDEGRKAQDAETRRMSDEKHRNLRDCAIQGIAECQRYYGGALFDRAHTDQDYREALKWTYRAAIRGITGSMMTLVREYSDESKPYYDPVEALSWGLQIMQWTCKECPHEYGFVTSMRAELSPSQQAEAEARDRDRSYVMF